MVKSARHIVLFLVAVALICATGFQRVPPAPATIPMHMAGKTCEMQVPTPDAGSGAEVPGAPCKAAMADCCKQIGVGDVGLPARLAAGSPACEAARVAYWPSLSSRVGLLHRPEPLPPRTA